MVDSEETRFLDFDPIERNEPLSEDLHESSHCENVITTPEGFEVCADTGEVLGERVLVDAPERVYRDDGRQSSRHGGPIDYSHHAYGIVTDVYSKRSRNVLSKDKMTAMRRLVRKHRVLAMTRRERQESQLFQILREVSALLGLGASQVQEAGQILHEFLNRVGVPSAREGKAVVAAIIHKIVEKYNLGISQQEILEKLEVEAFEMWNAKTKLNQSGALAVLASGPRGLGVDRILARIDTYITKAVQELGLPMDVRSHSLEFLKTVVRNGKSLYGKKPEVVAGATVYLIARVFGFDLSQADVARALKIRESSIRKLYRFLMDDMVVLIAI
ncbi:MAG: transcription initiation factor IIB family protein [Acidilobaceae archaeon]